MRIYVFSRKDGAKLICDSCRMERVPDVFDVFGLGMHHSLYFLLLADLPIFRHFIRPSLPCRWHCLAWLSDQGGGQAVQLDTKTKQPEYKVEGGKITL